MPAEGGGKASPRTEVAPRLRKPAGGGPAPKGYRWRADGPHRLWGRRRPFSYSCRAVSPFEFVPKSSVLSSEPADELLPLLELLSENVVAPLA